MPKRRHNLSFAKAICDLVHLPIPQSDFRDVAWGREVSDGSYVLVGRLDAILIDHEPGKLYLPHGEFEFLGVEHQTVLVAECCISSGRPPPLCQSG